MPAEVSVYAAIGVAAAITFVLRNKWAKEKLKVEKYPKRYFALGMVLALVTPFFGLAKKWASHPNPPERIEPLPRPTVPPPKESPSPIPEPSATANEGPVINLNIHVHREAGPPPTINLNIDLSMRHGVEPKPLEAPDQKWFEHVVKVAAAGETAIVNDMKPASKPEPSSPGFGFFGLLRVWRTPNPGSVLYVAEDAQQTRFWITIEPQGFTVHVSDDSHSESVSTGDRVPIGQAVYLHCDYGTAQGYSFLRVFVNGSERGYMRTATLKVFDFSSGEQRIGADLNGQNGAPIDVFEFGVLKASATWKQVADMLPYFADGHETEFWHFSGDGAWAGGHLGPHDAGP